LLPFSQFQAIDKLIKLLHTIFHATYPKKKKQSNRTIAITMTEQQFEARWQHNQEQRHAEATAVTGKWDQADAMLFLESGWTQERIAQKVGKGIPWVCRMLRFGNFANFARGQNHAPELPQAPIPSNLTERSFRAAWQKSAGKDENGAPRSENKRFEIVQDLLEAECKLIIGKLIRVRPRRKS
jgi:hypothetical protein